MKNNNDVWLFAIIGLGTACFVCAGLGWLWYGLRGLLLVLLAMTVCTVLCMAIRDMELEPDPEEDDEEKSCVGCVRYLGGGQCRSSLESECCEGGGFEMYEAKNDE